MKNVKIYFLANKLGHSIHKLIPSNFTNRRKFESEAFLEMQGLERTHFINNADILFFRNRGATTTDKVASSLLKRVDEKKLIINDVRSFLNYDSKDRAFKIWNENKLQCPDYISFSLDRINADTNIIEKIYKFYDRYNKILLRTNNETGSEGLYVINEKKEIPKVLEILKRRINQLILTRKDTKLMCVEYINAISNDNSHRLYRVHILFDKILSYYVSTSERNEFHNVDMRIKDVNPFISSNENFKSLIPDIKDDLIKAVFSLGCNIGALEFFLINKKPYFLELNPIWGGHASRYGFGDEEMMNYIYSNKNILSKKVPNIYQWLDYKSYYAMMYSTIRDYYLKEHAI